MTARTSWIVMQRGTSTGASICLRCGQTWTPTLPIPVSQFVKGTRAFIALHSLCREPERDTETYIAMMRRISEQREPQPGEPRTFAEFHEATEPSVRP